MARAADVLVEAAAVRERLARLTAPALQRSVDDVDGPPRPGSCGRGSCVVAGTARLDDVARYVRAIALPPRPPRRRRRPRSPPDGRGRRRSRTTTRRWSGAARPAHDVVELGWRLEELRVSVFAQPVGAKGGVSTTKLRRELATLS